LAVTLPLVRDNGGQVQLCESGILIDSRASKTVDSMTQSSCI